MCENECAFNCFCFSLYREFVASSSDGRVTIGNVAEIKKAILAQMSEEATPIDINQLFKFRNIKAEIASFALNPYVCPIQNIKIKHSSLVLIA